MTYRYHTKKGFDYRLHIYEDSIVINNDIHGKSYSASYGQFDFDLRSLPREVYDVMMRFLLYRLDELDMEIAPLALDGNKQILTYSGGADSTAILNNFDCIPVHLHRNTSNTYDLTQERAVKSVNGYIIPNDMEKLRLLYDGRFGFTTYSAPIIPVMSILGADTIIEGAIFDDVAFYYSDGFLYGIEENVGKRKMDHERLGIKYRYPLAGYSEVLTTQLANKSGINYSSCHNVKDSPCRWCYKCFRKLGFRGEKINDLSITKSILKKKPLKMASSTIYAIQKAGYYGPEFDRFKDIDVSFCDRVNKTMQIRYYDEDHILDGFEWQTEEDAKRIEKFVEIINDDNLYG